ncbi:MAG: thioredoxin family protein [Phycisphaerales bacterium]|nr:MAG: thioredoxin family protein [Phycisphaerales bacterium]
MIRSPNVRRCGPMTLCVAVVTTMTGCGTKLVWRPDLGGAMQLASRENRFVVVAYWSALNADCMEMERTVFQSQDVVDIMAGTVPVRLSPMLHKAWAREAGVNRVPSFVVYAPDGRILRRHEGFLDEAAFRGFIVAAKLSV